MNTITIGFVAESFKSKDFSFPVDDSEPNIVIPLSLNGSENIISKFIASLLTFSDMKLDEHFVEFLAKEEELALEGGLIFQGDTGVINPSCCSDFQDWKENLHDIIEHESPWMGHDPDPWIEFEKNTFTVWSSEGKSDFSLIYNYSIIPDVEAHIEKIILSMLQQTKTWANKYCCDLASSLVANMEKYLRVNSN